MRLVLYSDGEGWYRSALQAYQKERGLRGITKASVRVLGKQKMNPTAEVVAQCPQFTVSKPKRR